MRWSYQPVRLPVSWSPLHDNNAFKVTMTTLKHVILQDKDQDKERKLDWTYIEWAENEVVTTGLVDAQTQTDSWPFEHKEIQTCNPVLMHIDLSRTHSKLRHSSLVDIDGLAAPFFQFDRQAPGRISTSPTLRRMRSTRRSVMSSRDPGMMESTQEEPSSPSATSPKSPLSPTHRVTSPLAANPVIDDEASQNHQPGSQRIISHRSTTFDDEISPTKQQCHGAYPAVFKNSGCPDEVQVSRFLFWIYWNNFYHLKATQWCFSPHLCMCVCVQLSLLLAKYLKKEWTDFTETLIIGFASTTVLESNQSKMLSVHSW